METERKGKEVAVPKLEVLAALQRQLQLGLALNTFQPQDDLLRRLGLLVEDGLAAQFVSLSLRRVRVSCDRGLVPTGDRARSWKRRG